jgi:hypothetical protein
MTRYEESYGTDWDELDEDEAMERAYALGVSTSIGEYLPDELDAIRKEVGSSYQRSVIDLAFEEGKNEAREIDVTGDGAETTVWAELVEGETVTVDTDDVPTGGPNGVPDALDKMDIIERPDLDSTEAVDLPEFLQNDEN